LATKAQTDHNQGYATQRELGQSRGCDVGAHKGLLWFSKLRAAEHTPPVDRRSVPGQEFINEVNLTADPPRRGSPSAMAPALLAADHRSQPVRGASVAKIEALRPHRKRMLPRISIPASWMRVVYTQRGSVASAAGSSLFATSIGLRDMPMGARHAEKFFGEGANQEMPRACAAEPESRAEAANSESQILSRCFAASAYRHILVESGLPNSKERASNRGYNTSLRVRPIRMASQRREETTTIRRRLEPHRRCMKKRTTSEALQDGQWQAPRRCSICPG